MANKRSTQIKAIVTRSGLLDTHQTGGRQRRKLAVLENAGGVDGRYDYADAINTRYALARFNASDVIWGIEYTQQVNNAGATDNDLGIYVAGDWTVADQALVGTLDSLVDARTLAAAVGNPVNILGNGGTASTNMQTKFGAPLWSIAGLSAAPKPGTQYDIAMEKKVAAGAATLSVVCFAFIYSSGD